MDRELVERAQAGDRDAYEAVARASAPRLYATAYRIVRDTDKADEAVQQTLVAMWQELPSLRDTARFEAWTYRLCVRFCLLDSRRARRTGVREIEMDATTPEPADAYAASDLRDQTKIEELRDGKSTAIRVTNFYNNGGSSWAPLVEAMSAVACDVAAKHDAICVDIYAAFNGADGSIDPVPLGVFGPDGTHPSQKGMELIAEVLAAAGYAPLN